MINYQLMEKEFGKLKKDIFNFLEIIKLMKKI